jgi:hypothetical protein
MSMIRSEHTRDDAALRARSESLECLLFWLNTLGSRRKPRVQYLKRLAAEATVSGVDLKIERSWLMQ